MPAIESEIVELESPAVLAQLLAAWPVSGYRIGGRQGAEFKAASFEPTSPRPASTYHAQLPPLEAPKPTHRNRCLCGACVRCQDNARWTRIYDEKFADPSYYGGIFVRHNSSLAGA